jgi:hypothetical protein
MCVRMVVPLLPLSLAINCKKTMYFCYMNFNIVECVGLLSYLAVLEALPGKPARNAVDLH